MCAPWGHRGYGLGANFAPRDLSLEGRARIRGRSVDDDVGLAAEGAVEDRDLFSEGFEVELRLWVEDSGDSAAIGGARGGADELS